MTLTINMPALSPTMKDGKLGKWLKRPGEVISRGDLIAEVETDKAVMELEAEIEGRIVRFLVEEGTEGVAVDAPIIELNPDISAAAGGLTDAATPPSKSSGGGGDVSSGEALRLPPANDPELPPNTLADAHITPLAARMADQLGVDIAQINGTGPRGRITKSDILRLRGVPDERAEERTPSPVKMAPTSVNAQNLADLLKMPYRLEPLSGMRKTIARRLTESKQTVPHFYLTIDTEIDDLLDLRKRLNEKAGAKISVNDFVIRAVALALKKVPTANASYDESGMMYYEHADISVAVATPNGLITPIIKQAESKGLTQIATEMKDLAARARDGKLKPEEFQGGTFSISNLGMFGIKQFEAVINPPQGCILAIGAGEQRAVVKNGQIVPATVMTCTLSVDHRAIDGAVGAEFLQALKPLLEQPERMLL